MSTVYILDNQEEYSYHCVAFVRVDLEVWPNFEALAEVFGWAIQGVVTEARWKCALREDAAVTLVSYKTITRDEWPSIIRSTAAIATRGEAQALHKALSENYAWRDGVGVLSPLLAPWPE